MRKTLFAVALSIPMFASAATNLLTNGSFESGLTGWAVAGGGSVAPSSITYGSPGSASGEVIPTASNTSLSPDAAGLRALYFVDDNSTQTLTQTFTVATAGFYAVGFDTYVPANGYANAGNAFFSGSVDSVSVLTTSIGSLPATTWQANTGSIFLAAGAHSVTFSFATTGGFSKDVVIDRVYVNEATAVPEPESYALMLAGLTAVGFLARRRNRA